MLLWQYWKGYCALVAPSAALIFLRELHDLGRVLAMDNWKDTFGLIRTIGTYKNATVSALALIREVLWRDLMGIWLWQIRWIMNS
jgi:hypothetical protein